VVLFKEGRKKMLFSKENQPANNGRKKGGKNKRSQFSDELTEQALEQLTVALEHGEQWAVETVLKRTHAPLKAITPLDSLDGEYLTAKIFEIKELELRLSALEAKGTPHG